jgi:UDP-N-acetylglucosamine 4,6-dehydratase
MKDFGADQVNLDGRSILVTGGTGSFGNAFVRTVLSRYKPARVVVFSRDEAKQYDMAQALEYENAYSQQLRFFIGDVRDRDRLTLAMRGIDTVIHAAAMKHVPAAEYNPFECIKTNVNGAENVVYAALENNVEHVVALSTDKAESPINLYGASKLASDKIFVAANNLAGSHATRFAVVRYGNVVGSRGSVIPFFQKLIAQGAAELPITDARMTRFFITRQEGVDFVISSIASMNGGEIFIPKIPSMKIVDLATHMAPDMKQTVVGIRPGEKLHEALISTDNARSTVAYPDRYVIEPALAFWKQGHHTDQGATPVSEDFVYSSDRNDDWLTPERLNVMLEKLGA